jgi:RNA-directed DNA polymerase
MNYSLLREVRKIDALYEAWRVILENGRSSTSIETKAEIDEFGANAGKNLRRIQYRLARNSFAFKPARGVPILKKGGKAIRPIVIAPVESRIVQRAILNVLLNVPTLQEFHQNPYSFGGVKKQAGNDLAAVPAAINAVLAAISQGANFIIRSDVSSFFTRISKPAVTSIVAAATHDPDFVNLFSQAIAVELENLAFLREHASAFPIEEVGVAQGSSLSPFLGNILLSDFDAQMNAGTCRCIRYIDDFIILARDSQTAESQFKSAKKLLGQHGLSVSPEKTDRAKVSNGFEFLGIEMGNGRVAPSRESRVRLMNKIRDSLDVSSRAFRLHRAETPIPDSFSMTRTLSNLRGMILGWGNHYFFCNQKNLFAQLDQEVDRLLSAYFGNYKAVIQGKDAKFRRRLVGVPLLEELAFEPFEWPGKVQEFKTNSNALPQNSDLATNSGHQQTKSIQADAQDREL